MDHGTLTLLCVLGINFLSVIGICFGDQCPGYSSFANSYLPITFLSELINKKLPIPLPILDYFEIIKVTIADGPVSVLPPPSQNCPKVTDSYFLGINFGKLRIPLPIFYYFELIREVLVNTG